MDEMTIEKAKMVLESKEHDHEFETCPECEQAFGFIEGYESRDAEVNGLKNELDSLQRRFRKNSGEEYLRA